MTNVCISLDYIDLSVMSISKLNKPQSIVFDGLLKELTWNIVRKSNTLVEQDFSFGEVTCQLNPNIEVVTSDRVFLSSRSGDVALEGRISNFQSKNDIDLCF